MTAGEAQEAARAPVRDRARWVAAVTGSVLAAAGLWAFAVPASFFEVIATYEPYNRHFLHDLGAFMVGLGAVLVLAAWRPRHGLAVALTGVGIGSALHAVSHVVDRDLGGNPVRDIPALTVLAVLLLAAGRSAWRDGADA